MKLTRITVKNPFLLLVLFLLLTLLSFLAEKAYIRNRVPDMEMAEFQEILLEKEQAMDILLNRVAAELEHTGWDAWIGEYGEEVEKKLQGEGFTLLLYRNDSLIYWSDNNIPLPWEWSQELFSRPFLELDNSFHLGLYRESEPYRLVGMILIKYRYPYQNEFLRNEFQEDYGLPSWIRVMGPDEPGRQAFPVRDLSGNVVFYLTGLAPPSDAAPPFSVPGFLYLITFLSLLFFLASWFRIMPDRKRYFTGWLFSVLFLTCLKELLRFLAVPQLVYRMELFSPLLYAGTGPWASLGDLVIFAVISFFLVYLLYSGITRFHITLPERKNLQWITGIFLYALAGGWFLFVEYLFRSLIIHSSISFELHRLLDLSVNTFLALMVVGLLFFSAFLILDGIFSAGIKPAGQKKLQMMALAGITLSFLLTGWFTGFLQVVQIIIFFYLFNALLIWFRNHHRKGWKYSFLTLLVLLFSLLALYNIVFFNTEKEKNVRKVLAVNLATEHDAVAEVLLEEMGEKLESDTILAGLLGKSVFSPMEVDSIFEYLQTEYFSGFWEQYYLEITICDEQSELEILDRDTVRNCYAFFDEMLEMIGEALPRSNFWFLNDPNGRTTYFGRFSYPVNPDMINTLFIRLDSRLTYTHLGYPELLLDNRFEKSTRLERYSWARYIHNRLITQSGDFPYSLSLDVYNPPEEEFSFLHFDGYSHLIYRIDPDKQIIISTHDLRGIDLLIDASYLFVYFFLWMNIILLMINIPGIFRNIRLTFKTRIQTAMVGILFMALVLIGGGAVYYSIRQYRAKHNEMIREKIQSVYVVLDHELAYESFLDPGWSRGQYVNLNDLLVRYSNVFYTDINLYSPDGKLLATSRPEIFDEGLTGRRIDNQAYRELRWNRKAEFVHRENIGEMSFLSAYVPFTNAENQLLAYLNLPYFTKQISLSREISLLVVAIVNISFLLLILTIFLAVLISNKITDPLRMIQRKFSRLKLGRSYEKISYEGEDEIGELVHEYNRMVTELARSVEKLARSERESAWREMARQVAHEIKNPLTPMKLSIQQVKRAYEDRAPGWEENFQRFTRTMIEQIENLSAIANAFSHFAQMPTSSFEPVNMVEKVWNIAELFGNTENVEIRVDVHGLSEAMVVADKEQMLRVLTNLVKNAIQAIPEDRPGRVGIDLTLEGKRVIIAVSDNGKGIPDELGEKLFVPNFTTKSSGMGLGLAIVRNIVSNTGGSIHYETRVGEGTTFYVELPVYHPENQSSGKESPRGKIP